jgi:transposase
VQTKTTENRQARNQCIEQLGRWDGYRVGTVQRFEAGVKSDQPQVWIELHPKADRVKICDGCGETVAHVHEITQHWVRDLPIFDARTHLLVHRCRLACPRCGPNIERLAWLERYARVTTRLAESVARLCAVLPIKHVAHHFNLGWDTVKAIDKAYLNRTLGPPQLDDVQHLAMDEFAIQKGHRYATVVIEPATRRVLWVGRGRDRESVRPFFTLLGVERCQLIDAVAMDMNSAYEQEVKANCPQAEIVYDLFHVVAKYGREVIDRVRVDEANRLRHDKPARKVIKSSRWLLLRNRTNIARREDRVRLNELLGANRRLMTVYVLKDDLKHLWSYRSRGHALRFWKGWYRRAMRSRIEPLKRFARRLREYLPGILSHCRNPLHTSVLEGINNKIKVIKRMAYGFRDDEYFFLKIRAAFPGNDG